TSARWCRERSRLTRWFASLFFFQAEDGIRDFHVTGVQTCALPISPAHERFVFDTIIELSRAEYRRRVERRLTVAKSRGQDFIGRSEERRVGKECRFRRKSEHCKSNKRKFMILG